MMLDNYKKIDVYRLAGSPGNKKEEYELIGNIKGVIMPSKIEDTMICPGSLAETANLYAEPNCDIKESDKIECDDKEYIIKHLKRIGFGALEKIKAIIVKAK